MYDVFFICYDESNREENWQRVLQFHPNAIRIDGVKGINTAHLKCNDLSTTPYFWTVDGDNWLLERLDMVDDINYDVLLFLAIDSIDQSKSSSGSVKLWRKDSIVNKTMSHGDFCQNATKRPMVIRKTLSIHKYDNTPYEAWRHTFRHLVKCYSRILPADVKERTLNAIEKHKDLNVYSYRGFLDAKEYVEECSGDFNKINLINDYKWLKLKCPKEMQSPLV
jgi:hypothetical protein